MKTTVQTIRSTPLHTSTRSAAAVLAVALGMGAAVAQMTPTQPAQPAQPTQPTPTTQPAPAPAQPQRSAQGVPTPNETMFKRIDADNNGSISKAELDKADANLARDFDRYDTDKDGKLSMAEFEAMLKAIRGQ